MSAEDGSDPAKDAGDNAGVNNMTASAQSRHARQPSSTSMHRSTQPMSPIQSLPRSPSLPERAPADASLRQSGASTASTDGARAGGILNNSRSSASTVVPSTVSSMTAGGTASGTQSGHRSHPSTSRSITFSDTGTLGSNSTGIRQSSSANAGQQFGEADSIHSTIDDAAITPTPGDVNSTFPTNPRYISAASTNAVAGSHQPAKSLQSHHQQQQNLSLGGQSKPRARIPLHPSGPSSANTTAFSSSVHAGNMSGLGAGGAGVTLAPPPRMSRKQSAGGLGVSLRPDIAVVKGKARSRSRSRVRSAASDSDDDNDDGDTSMGPGDGRTPTGLSQMPRNLRRKSFDHVATPLPPISARLGSDSIGIDDDEVPRRDRGEELVLRRMRERKKEKRAAEKRDRKRREDEIKRERQREFANLTKGQSVTGAAGAQTTVRDSIISNATNATASGTLNTAGHATSPEDSAQQGRSESLSREGSHSTAQPGSPYSSHITYPLTATTTGYWPPPTGMTQLSATQTPISPFFPSYVHQQSHLGIGGLPHADRSVSYATSNASTSAPQPGVRESDFFSDAEQAEEYDRVPELQSKVDAAWRDEMARSMHSHDDDAANGHAGSAVDHEEEAELGSDEEDAAEDDEDEDEDDIPGDGVEYTLKDRQDAINIEHPFGLPIWKPALYKKSRSTNRNAEHELHESPSYNVEHHFLSGNIGWTLLTGWWLAIVFMLPAAALHLVPFGGAKYGKILWDTGVYLFWPFGRYVERYDTSGSPDDVRGYDELSNDGEGSTIYEDTARPRDIEEAGRTWPRTRVRNSSSDTIIRHHSHDEDGPDNGTRSDTPTPERPNAYGLDAAAVNERAPLLSHRSTTYGTESKPLDVLPASSGSETEVADGPHVDDKHDEAEVEDKRFRVRALGRLSYWTVFYLFVAPIMLFVCAICWACVFTIPMAKVMWILITHLHEEPLALAFRYPSPNYYGNNSLDASNGSAPPIEAGQKAPRHSRKTYDQALAMGRILGPEARIILCTYKAVGIKYYKYTIDGTNILFINLLPLMAFVIFDFFFILPVVEHRHLTGFWAFIAGQGTIFTLALLSVIPLSYFIGMAVASISAQSSIGMGAVINATFGSIIEIILYGIALTQGKGQLVEGSIVGSLLAGVLLMPGLSMVAGAFRRKEQKFNARSAGVTSTMLIMAIIGILTPTLFYQIYGTFKLTCTQCPNVPTTVDFSCQRCFYEHVDPVDDIFFETNVKGLSYYCAIILALSYLIGLWFSLRTHASHIWQNQQASAITAPPTAMPFVSGSALPTARVELPRQASMYKKAPVPAGHPRNASYTSAENESLRRHVDPAYLAHRDNAFSTSTPMATPTHVSRKPSYLGQEANNSAMAYSNVQLPPGVTAEEVNRAFHLVAATASAMQSQNVAQSDRMHTPGLKRMVSHAPLHEREMSRAGNAVDAGADHGEGHGGHDAPNWSRFKSYSVLVGCTMLYAIIAEILVDVVDVVLNGSGIPEKFLGITLFALVPNTTEFMNAISFALNGNIALSMEIGSAYALQVCLLQIPAMVAFTAFYSIGKDTMIHRAFTLIFPRWDAICIMFSVFLLTYVYLESRSNYYRGSILVLSYLVLLGGFYAAPPGLDNSDDPLFTLRASQLSADSLSLWQHAQTIWYTLFSH